MTITLRLVRLAAREAVRGRWLVGLAVGLATVGELLLRFAGGGPSTVLSLLDIALIITPLAGLVLGTIQVHHAREVTELLLAQPVARGRLFTGLWLGSTLPLAAALAVGLAAPFAWHGMLFTATGVRLAALVGTVVLLTLVSGALAFVIAMRVDDRVRALGVALAAWFVAAIAWDGLVLLVAMVFAERAVEVPVLMMLALNPLDVARLLLIVGSDAAAMLGYTGAVLARTLGADLGRAMLVVTLLAWTAVPLWWARRSFVRKDF
jgi:Cu-processing system permease protein